MKIKLFSFIIFFFLVVIQFLNANETEYGGPTTISDAKDRFFKDRKLDIIEGVWYVENDLAMYAIVKVNPGVYHTWTIDHQVPRYIGTRNKYEVTRKTANDEVYIKKTTIYNTQNPSQEAIAQGTLILSNNYYEVNWPRGCWETNICWASFATSGIRMWPENIYTYNKKIESKKISQKTKYIDSSESLKDYWWVLIILGLGVFFLYSTTVKKPLRKFKKIKTSKKTEGRIAKYWAGKDTLVFSFWGVCFLLLGALYIPLIVLADAADNMSLLFLSLGLIYVIFFFAVAVVAYVGCWRSAGSYIKIKLKKNKSAFWGYATYVYLSLSVLRSTIAFFQEF